MQLSISGRCEISRVPKKNGTCRLIYKPRLDFLEQLFSVVSIVEDAFRLHGADSRDHAFVSGRNCTSNALCHFGKGYVLKLDIKDFFDSVTPALVRSYLADRVVQIVMEDGAARQGLLTSPLVANLAMIVVDRRIAAFCSALGISYSRYSDDMTFGFDDRHLKTLVLKSVELILDDYGFVLNKGKTKLQNARNGALIITGVALTPAGVVATRETRRRIRAADHQRNVHQLKGLKEWEKCKPPSNFSVSRHGVILKRNRKLKKSEVRLARLRSFSGLDIQAD